MKTEMKVLLYIKRSGQDKDGFSPLMGRISVKGRVNSIAQFACKFKIEVQLWNATAQRCTGKSKVATMANREIERVLLLLQKRFNELFDIQDVVTAEEVRNVFQGLAETQDTIMKLYAEHNSDYALRVGVNRAVNTFYQYQNTYRILGAFLKEKYHVSDMPVKQLDESFIEAFDMYMRTTRRFHAQNHTRTCQPPEKRDDACRVPWHRSFQPVQRLCPTETRFQTDVPDGRRA